VVNRVAFNVVSNLFEADSMRRSTDVVRSIRLARTALLIAVAGLVFGAGGCGRRIPHGDRPWSQAKVVVRVGSEPLVEGEVAFLADQGSSGVDAGGVLDAKGVVTIPLLPGDYTVVIRPLPLPEEELAKPRSGPNAAQPRLSPIPPRFQSPRTSPCKATISPREHRQFTFDLSSTNGS
jgi:hypothetical protein